MFEDDARPMWLCITEQWRTAGNSPSGAHPGKGGKPAKKAQKPEKSRSVPKPKEKVVPLAKISMARTARSTSKPHRARFVGPPKPKGVPSPSHTKESRHEYQRRWIEGLTDDERRKAWKDQYARRDKLRLKAYYWAYHQASKSTRVDQ